MARYLDPKADLTFKRIFGEHPKLLISFLNAVMPFEPGRYIEEIEYLSAEMTPDNPAKKFSVVDVRCTDNFRRQFIVEMQTRWYEAFMNRIVFNAGKAYVKQLGRSEDYHLLQPVYTLSILNRNFDKKTPKFYHHFQIINRENSDEIIPCLEFVLVELTEKFRPETIADHKLMVLWLRFLQEVVVFRAPQLLHISLAGVEHNAVHERLVPPRLHLHNKLALETVVTPHIDYRKLLGRIVGRHFGRQIFNIHNMPAGFKGHYRIQETDQQFRMFAEYSLESQIGFRVKITCHIDCY